MVQGFGRLPEAQERRPDLAHLDVSGATESYDLPSLATLRALAAGEDVEVPRYLRNWTRDFHYVYLLGAHTENALPGVLDVRDGTEVAAWVSAVAAEFGRIARLQVGIGDRPAVVVSIIAEASSTIS